MTKEQINYILAKQLSTKLKEKQVEEECKKVAKREKVIYIKPWKEVKQ